MTTGTLAAQFTYTNSTPTIIYGDAAVCINRDVPNDCFMKVSDSGTTSVELLKIPQRELNPFECCFESGVLDFWNDHCEDIYTSEDGQTP